MNILIVHNSKIPVRTYGGIERVIWDLGKELAKSGHNVFYLVSKGSLCDFAKVLFIDESKNINSQIPDFIDIVHFNSSPGEPINKPYVVTIHGNFNHTSELDINSIFISKNHASRFGSTSFVYNGLDWNDYGKPDLNKDRKYFHFLGNAAWRLKNVKGAIKVISLTKSEKLKVLGGTRINFRMGFRFTLSLRVSFEGMVGGEKKIRLLEGSKGLIFPVRWHEPFGLAITESLYMGCPVFATPYGSLPELVNKEVGFLSNNSRDLAAEVENAGGYDKKKCHEYAADTFNSHKMAEKYLQMYFLVLNGTALNDKKPRLHKVQTEKFLQWS